MPNYVSVNGIWYPAEEKVALVNNDKEPKKYPTPEGEKIIQSGEPFIYKGPDRAAEFELYKAGVKTFGIDFRTDPEIIGRARAMGYNNVLDFAVAMGWQGDIKKDEDKQLENLSKIVTHDAPKKSEAHEMLGGGTDNSGQGKSFLGGFGDEKLNPV